ncbi:helix-turn-helix transcriptional regulator [Paenibacillus sp. MMS20-IR301]|uniref:helix-turn-helix domain-containing protein n=1 Tax=Paenibacillus sp. MMS20-IR301 TaxID=2895946 RepID=UPI0028E9ADE9|nr:helix-turn-helix transcriptional regulator [Paenibacillus sp. MMS20-IR301]WNS41999.1 helix-turn-helix transcriptional regulator [Paenibacillus sp. MMS20-IR301]
MVSSETTGKRIATLRKAKGLSQEQLAEKLEVSAQAVSKWENGKSLPETATLPRLSAALGHSIDSILLPQELVVLSAVYTDGQSELDVTQFVNQFVTGNRLSLSVGDQTFPQPLTSDRMKLLLVTYETPSGVYSAYVEKDQQLTLDIHSAGYTAEDKALRILYATYGNERAGRSVLNKLKHYEHFQWKFLTASHELFPSLIGNDGNDYLLLVYLNAEGIHAVSCAEGERLHYSPDRSRLYQRNAADQQHIIEGISRLGFGRGMDCSWAGAMMLALTASGIDTTYNRVMGNSGACWRVAFEPVWDYSSADALVAYDYSVPACRAYGIHASRAERLEPQQRAAEKLEILEDLRAGRLPVAINLRVAPEWGVITGYLEDGRTLLCRSYFDDETFKELKDDPEFQADMAVSMGYLFVDHWPYKLIRLGELAEAPSALDNLYASLRLKLDSMRTADSGSYKVGYSALESWREGLLDHKWYAAADDAAYSRRLEVNRFCMMALADARRSAAAYLTESLPLLQASPGAGAIAEMAGLYGKMAALLEEFYAGLAIDASGSPRQSWTAAHREKQAELLTLVASLEELGDTLARSVLDLGPGQN